MQKDKIQEKDDKEMICITGDTHGEYNELLSRMYNNQIKKGDTAIVCGDFGFVWNDPYHRYFISKLTAENFTIAFVDGNHEDFDLLETYPVTYWNGGKVHKIAENIYHLMRGQRFVIEGKSFFTMGGAYSVDKEMRTEHISWWSQELPSDNDYKTAEMTLKKYGYNVDYILTHTLPQSAIHYLGLVPCPQDAELTGYFEWLKRNLKFKMWFSGHFHMNRLVDDKIRVLFNDVVKL